MGKTVDALKNGWGRVLITITLSALAAYGGATFALGQYKERVDNNKAQIEHIVATGTDHSRAVGERVTKLEAQIDIAIKQLDRIEAKIDRHMVRGK